MLSFRAAGGRGCARWRESDINVSWSRSVDMEVLLGLVASETFPVEIDRLQLLSQQA
jgi:hypothetical protein